MEPLTAIDRDADLLARTIRPAEGTLSVEAARSFLSFQLSSIDRTRVNELAAKARAGTLTAAERAALDEYERITCWPP